MKKFLTLFVLAVMILSLTTAEAKKYGDDYTPFAARRPSRPVDAAQVVQVDFAVT